MHIPDGFLSPATTVVAGIVAVGAWALAGRRLRDRLDVEAVPRLAVVTALAYGLGLVMIPLPGATPAHLIGVSLLALVAGVRQAFLAYSLVLLLQALVFGAGGIAALPVNALAIGLAGAVTTVAIYRLLRRWHETAAVAVAAWVATVASALLVALVLGAQPLISRDSDGHPLHFPIGWSIVVPALVLPHLLIGIGEAAVTVLVWRTARARGWVGNPALVR